jgi:hypothetical protein
MQAARGARLPRQRHIDGLVLQPRLLCRALEGPGARINARSIFSRAALTIWPSRGRSRRRLPRLRSRPVSSPLRPSTRTRSSSSAKARLPSSSRDTRTRSPECFSA